MKIILVMLRKEFLQIFRNRSMLPIIFVAPVIQLLILASAATYEIKNIAVIVVDQDQTGTSRLLVSKMKASGYFIMQGESTSDASAYRKLQDGQADIILEIPAHFERDLVKGGKADLLLSANAINNIKATLGTGYAASIIASFNRQIRVQFGRPEMDSGQYYIKVLPIPWFNPTLN
ncbi:MAG TPA: ABC transporter permease, partial [Chitinophagaceae bacterium]|nr:ABC transporter permease [Chitinophagaceae bacterium]